MCSLVHCLAILFQICGHASMYADMGIRKICYANRGVSYKQWLKFCWKIRLEIHVFSMFPLIVTHYNKSFTVKAATLTHVQVGSYM